MTSRVSRRTVLEGMAAALPLAAAWPRARWLGGSEFDPWVEVNSANIRSNLKEVGRRAEGRPVLAVVKNSGYGLGHLNAARVLEPEPLVSGFAVIKLSEALALRDGGIKKPVLWMGPVDEASLREATERGITPMIYTPVGDVLAKIAAERGRRVPIQFHIDTGLGREGVPFRIAKPLLDDLLARPGIDLTGVMTGFSEDPELDHEQTIRFTEFLEPYRRSGAKLGRRHAASSMRLFGDSSGFFDQVRPGLALWGVYSELRLRNLGLLDLKPAGALRARVAYVKQLEAGQSAGYDRAFVAREPTWVATVPMGHVDGVPRVAVKGASMRINDRMAPIVSVSASHTIVTLGSQQTCRQGDVATLFDWREGSRPEDIGAACGVSLYDLMMHLDSSLPRRVLVG